MDEHITSVSFDKDSPSKNGQYLWICSCNAEGYQPTRVQALAEAIRHRREAKYDNH